MVRWIGFSIFLMWISMALLYSNNRTGLASSVRINASQESNSSVSASISSQKIGALDFNNHTKLDPKFHRLPDEQIVNIVIVLPQNYDLSAIKSVKGKDAKARKTYTILREASRVAQAELQNWLEAEKINFKSFYLVNAISCTTNVQNARKIAERADVLQVIEDAAVTLETTRDTEEPNGIRAIETSLQVIGAPTAWNQGFKGQNVVIGGQDTGVDWDHPAIISQYKGWNGSTANHNYAWHDAIDNNAPQNTGTNPCGYTLATPCDDDSHGTHTVGTMVGDDGGANQIGVAPEAKWIGCRNMERGWGTLSTYLECFEWFLAPYPYGSGPENGDPSQMPHVINNSWGCPSEEGCNPSNFAIMGQAIENLRTAGCVVVVSAGNSGPGCATVSTPAAIFEGSFTVGATNNSNAIASFSSRGPVTVDGSNRLKPDVTAPGMSIRSCIPGTGYGSKSGTSMAGPHVAGVVALMISANPDLAGEVELISQIIEETAVPLTTTQTCGGVPGSSVPNNTFGHGRINAAAAVTRAVELSLPPAIKVDLVGYRPQDKKVATLANPKSGYNEGTSYTPAGSIHLIDAMTNQIVFSTGPILWNNGATHGQSGDEAWFFDFSSWTQPGRYYIRDGNNFNIKSPNFSIEEDIYKDIQKLAFKTFYLQRCGIAKSVPYVDSAYADAACHTQDQQCRSILDPNNPARYRDLSGGWHDAGDYNKYINFAGPAIHDLLWSYEMNPQAWADDMEIPESGNGIPDLLDEVKYELDWFIKMQDTDGGVFSLVGVQNNATASPPSQDQATRYYGPKTTSATLTAAMSFAWAAYQFQKINHPDAQVYANTLRSRAIQAWNWAAANANVTFMNSSNNLAAGEQELDTYERDMRKLCAAVYLYAVTQDLIYKNYVEEQYLTAHMMQWSFVYPFENQTQTSLLFFAHLPGVTNSIATNIKNTYRSSVDNSSDNLPAHNAALDPYGAFITTNNIVWGSNRVKTDMGNIYQIYQHFDLDPSKNELLEEVAARYIHYLHGRNPNSLVYLTNLSDIQVERSINTIYHNWFTDGSTLWDDVKTSTYGPAPGFVSGGPNPGWSLDGCCPNNCGSPQNNALCTSLSPPSNQPPLKAYRDWNTSWPQNSWSVTENAIYYQASYLLLLSRKIRPELTNSGPSEKVIVDRGEWYFPSLSSGLVWQTASGEAYRFSIAGSGQISKVPHSSSASASSTVSNGSLQIIPQGKGLLFRSPGGIYRLKVDKAGTLRTEPVGSLDMDLVQTMEGDLKLAADPFGLILRDQEGICYRLQLGNDGQIFSQPIKCLD